MAAQLREGRGYPERQNHQQGRIRWKCAAAFFARMEHSQQWFPFARP
jgi:hypothetical protein